MEKKDFLDDVVYTSKAIGFRDAFIELMKISIEENAHIPERVLNKLEERMNELYPRENCIGEHE